MCPTPGKWSGSEFAWLRVGSGEDCSSHPLHVGRKWEARWEHKCEFTDFSQSKNVSMGKQVIKEGMRTLACLSLTESGMDCCSCPKLLGYPMAPSPKGDRAHSPLYSCNSSVWLWGRPCKLCVRCFSAPGHPFPFLAYSLSVESFCFPGGILNSSMVCQCSVCQGESWGNAVPKVPQMGPAFISKQPWVLPPPLLSPLQPPFSCCPKFSGPSQARSGLNKHKPCRVFPSHGAA